MSSQGARKEETVQGRWEQLAEVAFRLSEIVDAVDLHSRAEGKPELAREKLEGAAAALDDLLEIFGKEIDPVDDLPGYATRRLIVALRRAVT